MNRTHTPYGYQIQNGIAVICEEHAEQVRKIYKGYLSGLSLQNAARKAGINLKHASVKCILQNRHYLGDDFYPEIIDRATFDAVQAERQRREKALGRDGRVKKTVETLPAPTSFKIGRITQSFSDPYHQAEYIYSLIESEV